MTKKVLGLRIDARIYYKVKVLFWNLGFCALWYDIYHLLHWTFGVSRNEFHPSLEVDMQIVVFGGEYFSERHFAYTDAKRETIHWERIRASDGQRVGLPGIIERFWNKQVEELLRSC